MELAVFILFAGLALVSAIVVVSHRNPVYSTMSLVVTFFSLAVLYVLLGAPFIATLQVLIYTGAILVLFLFVIMLLNVGREEGQVPGNSAQRWLAFGGGAVFAGTVLTLIWRAFRTVELAPLTPEGVAIKPLAKELFNRYLLGFEMIGLLLLAAVIAATVLARKNEDSPSTNRLESAMGDEQGGQG